MKKIGLAALAMIISALFVSGAFAQAAPAGNVKIGLIDSGAFGGDEKGVGGITKFVNAAKALQTEIAPRAKELETLQTRIQTLATEIDKLGQTPGAVPANTQKTIADKTAEGQRLQRELEYKNNEYKAYVAGRQKDVLEPIQSDILKAVQDYAKKNGYSLILDIDRLWNAQEVLFLDPAADVTKDFITYYNARPAGAATAAAPRQ